METRSIFSLHIVHYTLLKRGVALLHSDILIDGLNLVHTLSFYLKKMMNEVILKKFVCCIDAKLLQAVTSTDLKAKHVQQSLEDKARGGRREEK